LTVDLEDYRRRAERFSEELSREYYLHLAGHKGDLEIEPIYEKDADLFAIESVEGLRELTAAADGVKRRQLRYLLHFALDGLLGHATRSESAELARLEASLEIDPGDGPVPYRAVPIEQANEPRAHRREALQEARGAVLEQRLNPIYRAALERAHDLCVALDWPSYTAAYEEVRGIDLETLAGQASRFLLDTDDAYEAIADPALWRAGLPGLDALRRSDLPRFFRAPDLDLQFPAERMVAALSETLAALGIDLGAQESVRLDTERRRTKSPRAFCSAPRIPHEIYLVIAPSGGRDDYEALFHEAGHAQHYASTDPDLEFEFRHLGDNSVTESFAFLLQHLVEDGEWLGERLGIDDPRPAVEHARAAKLVMLRRYAAKLAYELELHGDSTVLGRMSGRYAELLTEATRIPWPSADWLADVDGGFYAACYLRAWALETRWRAALAEQFGARWFDCAEAGEWLRALWSRGQRLDADELLAESLGRELELAPVAAELAPAPG
jgi:hypothetical protein